MIVVDNVQPDGNGVIHLRQLSADGHSVVENTEGVLSVPALLRERVDIIPAAGQAQFDLPRPLWRAPECYVNGALQDSDACYYRRDSLTWLGEFSLETDDVVTVLAAHGSAERWRDRFVPTPGQTVFNLARRTVTIPEVFVNGQLQNVEDLDYAGTEVVWLTLDFQLGPDDVVDILYTPVTA